MCMENQVQKSKRERSMNRDIFWKEKMRMAESDQRVDEVTGLYHLERMKKKIEERFEEESLCGQLWAVDIDGFTKLQEKYGQLLADEVICDVVSQVRCFFQGDYYICRNGEDEILVFTMDIMEKEGVVKSAEQLCTEIRQMYGTDWISCGLTVSIGIASAPEQGKEFDELHRKAECAVGFVKGRGGDGAAVFEDAHKVRHVIPKTPRPHRSALFAMIPRDSLPEYIFKLLSDAKDIQATVNYALQRIACYYEADHCAVYLVENDHLTLNCKYESRSSQEIRLSGQIVNFTQQGWKDRKERLEFKGRAQVVDLHSSEKGVHYSEVFSMLPDTAKALRVAMYAVDAYVGEFYVLDYSGTKKWDEEEIHILETLGSVFGSKFMLDYRMGRVDVSEGLDELDTLTEVYKLDAFVKYAGRLLEETKERYNLVYMDIGNFKVVNRDCGYEVGDRVLKECARILREEIENVHYVGRVYGDKFAILSKRIEGEPLAELEKRSYKNNRLIKEKLCAFCKEESILIHTGLYQVQPGDELGVALSRAKMAKNIAKQQMTARPIFYESWMSDRAQKGYDLIVSVDEAIANKEFMVYLQPKVNSETQQIIGAEALVRWQKPDGSMVFPDDFIPVLEKNGKIVDVDYYVYEEVFQYLRRRLDAGLAVVPISMNVSRVHLQNDDFIDKVNELLDKYQIPCEYLEFELTENIYVEKMQEALPFVENVRKKKIKVSIDDFGSGYSSLNVISSIPLDVLKLDKAFMKRGGELSKKDKSVIVHLVRLAKDIELDVLCEGVETEVQAEFVKSIGCDAWQGYCFAKPMPMEEFDKYLDGEIPVK